MRILQRTGEEPSTFTAGAGALRESPPDRLRRRVAVVPPEGYNSHGGARDVRELDLEVREARIFAEVASGNVPGWLRTLSPVTVTGEGGGRER